MIDQLKENNNMSKILCKCGNMMVVHTMEEDFLYDLIPQKALMDIVGGWKNIRADIYPDSLTNLYNQFRKDVFICPVCHRLLIESDEDPNLFDSYVKEAK